MNVNQISNSQIWVSKLYDFYYVSPLYLYSGIQCGMPGPGPGGGPLDGLSGEAHGSGVHSQGTEGNPGFSVPWFPYPTNKDSKDTLTSQGCSED